MNPDPEPAVGRDLSVPLERISVLLLLPSLLLFALPIFVFLGVHGRQALLNGDGLLALLLWMVVLIVAHEAVHGIGWKLAGGLRWQDLRFGVKWSALAPYCHATVPMTARAYRIGAVLPLLLVGILPFAWALLTGSGIWAILSALLISGAVGDVYILWLMRELRPTAIVRDHDSAAGCYVLDEG